MNVQTRNNQSHMRSQDTNLGGDDALSPGLGAIPTLAHQNSNSNLNPHFAGFHGTTASGQGSQDSGVEAIENPYSRAGKRRMMGRPPTQSGIPNDAHMQSVGSH